MNQLQKLLRAANLNLCIIIKTGQTIWEHNIDFIRSGFHNETEPHYPSIDQDNKSWTINFLIPDVYEATDKILKDNGKETF